MKHPTSYRTIQVDGLSIFYREAGPNHAPTLLLLHGLPSSSRMFEPLFARLSDRYHLVAPDYPGFGHSDWPDPKHFAYTFDHIAEIIDHFTEVLGLSCYTLYMQDYGGPVGFRMALAHPDRIEALIVQDAVAHDEGLGANWKPRRAFWADRAANECTLRTNLLSLPTTRTRHVGDDPDVERYNPDLWTDEFAFLNQPGQGDIQSDLFYDYRTNLDAYPQWQAWMCQRQPRLLVIWGRYDRSFELSEPEAYRHDVPNAQVHVLDAGHFALDTAADEIAALVRGFVDSSQREIANLLDRTQAAHGAYEVRELNGVYDQAWPAWYAAYLVEHGIDDLLGRAITTEQLARLLKQYDEEYRAQHRQEGWPNYYAAQLLVWRDAAGE